MTDPIGKAIEDYFENGTAEDIVVHSSMFDDDVIPVSHLFRSYKQMPKVEQTALKLAQGRVLDVGAAAGSHALWLQNKGVDITAIDISQKAVDVMLKRGLQSCINADYYYLKPQTFDTLLFLMNGSGIIGEIHTISRFFTKAKELLSDNGSILMDSSDLRYLFENEDGSYDLNIAGAYYGEVQFTMSYKGRKGELFNWLYIDFNTLEYYAHMNGFQCELICEGDHYDYLARLTSKD